MKIAQANILFGENPNPMWVYDPANLSIKMVNEAACNMYGYTKKEFLKLTIADLRPNEEISKLKKEVTKKVDKFNNAGIWKHRKKNGEIIFVRVLSHPVSENNNQYKLVTAQDVTNEINYQQELQMLLENSLDGIILASPDGQIFKANQSACRILGMSEKQIIDLGRDGLVLKDEKLEAAIKERKKIGKFSGELTLIHSSGKKVPIEISTSEYKNPQGQLRASAIFRDVTDHRKLEQLLDQAYSMAKIGAWEYDIQSDNLYWSSITKELHEVAPNFKPDLETAIYHYRKGKSRTTIQKAVQKAIENGVPWDEELQIITAKGNLKWVRTKGEPEIIDEKCHRLYGILQDIQERKEAQSKMMEAVKNQKRILERIKEAFFATDSDWNIIYWNRQAEKISGISRENILGNNLWDLFAETKTLDAYKKLNQSFKQQTPISFEEYYPPLEAWFEVQAHPSKDGLSVFFRDITARKQNQIELQKAHQEKESILESIGDGFFSVNKDWVVTYWNKAAEKMLETPKDIILGKNLWEVFNDATDLPSFTNYHKVMNTGVSVHFEDYYAALDRWYDISAYPSEEGISVYFKNITDQKNKEQELRESLNEKETLLAEIHHRVKNNLAVVSGMLQLQAFEEESESVKYRLNSSITRIKTIGNIHELLYKSESFSKLDIDQNLHKLVTEVAETFQPAINVDITFKLQKISLDINQAIPLSLIVNEVITNIFKHAFEETEHNKLSVVLSEHKNNKISLNISNNGTELPPDFKITESTSSLGLKLIDTLSTQLEAHYKYESTPEKTHFKLSFEKSDIKGSASSFVK